MSKYSPLRKRLAGETGRYADMTFGEIDALIGGLPASARRYQAWWSNERDGRHVQAHAWMDPGWIVSDVNLIAETVRFTKSR